MGNRPFQDFAPEFLSTANKCGKTSSQMVEALRVRISDNLSKQVTSQTARPEKDDFDG